MDVALSPTAVIISPCFQIHIVSGAEQIGSCPVPRRCAQNEAAEIAVCALRPSHLIPTVNRPHAY